MTPRKHLNHETTLIAIQSLLQAAEVYIKREKFVAADACLEKSINLIDRVLSDTVKGCEMCPNTIDMFSDEPLTGRPLGREE